MKESKTLTVRQKECLELSAFGFTNFEIGEYLFISENTVKHTLGEAFRRLKAKDRVNAIAMSFFHELATLRSHCTYQSISYIFYGKYN